MVPVIETTVDDFIAVISKVKRKGEAFDVYPLLKRFTIDNISRAGFGVDSATLADPDKVCQYIIVIITFIIIISDLSFNRVIHSEYQVSLLMKAGLEIVDNANVGRVDLVVNSFQWIALGMKSVLRFLFNQRLISHPSDDLFVECQKIVELRRTSGTQKTDLLQALLNASGNS